MKTALFQINRRSFLKTITTTAASTGIPAWFLERDVALSADTPVPRSLNDRPSIALIGCGGMGRGDAKNAKRFGDVVAVCDVDAGHAAQAAKELSEGAKTPAVFADFRKLLERDDIQAVINATPDHWHTLVNLAAARTRKDVYSEKPLTLTIDEGRRLVAAVAQAKTVLQTGSQQRSDRRFRMVCELVRHGRLGRLKTITVWLPAGLRGGPFASSTPPPGLDWDFWLGQAPKVDYVKERCHTNFRFWFDYSGGTMTDWGAHHNDIAFWAANQKGPAAVEGRVLTDPVPGGYTAFSEYEVTLTYPNGVAQVVRTTKDDSIFGGMVNQDGQRNGIRFEGTDGWIWVNRGELDASDEALYRTPLPESAERLYASSDHMGNFFECMRSRKAPICEPAVGHRSASICHIGVIALRVGARLQWNATTEQFEGDRASEANALVARPMRKPYDYTFVS